MDNTYHLFWTLLIIQAIICGILSGVVADAKNRDSSGWCFVGFFFGILGLIAIAGMPTIHTMQSNNSLKHDHTSIEDNHTLDEVEWRCTNWMGSLEGKCNELNSSDAKVCSKCGAERK